MILIVSLIITLVVNDLSKYHGGKNNFVFTFKPYIALSSFNTLFMRETSCQIGSNENKQYCMQPEDIFHYYFLICF
ncbi:protein of unknown function [Candidatus Nitrosocosmicus franklandus]|uniref:Uncharacterized protein n=1 Tax=Candidatus Nitrosocosmicus franklandianus TaxID=1798806 RepID=A0A484IC67_9ARCH|nr:protein of unknown function [Candidatus Nitrosocosmicus franklandus]